jgi:hypothetical protein
VIRRAWNPIRRRRPVPDPDATLTRLPAPHTTAEPPAPDEIPGALAEADELATRARLLRLLGPSDGEPR